MHVPSSPFPVSVPPGSTFPWSTLSTLPSPPSPGVETFPSPPGSTPPWSTLPACGASSQASAVPSATAPERRPPRPPIKGRPTCDDQGTRRICQSSKESQPAHASGQAAATSRADYCFIASSRVLDSHKYPPGACGPRLARHSSARTVMSMARARRDYPDGRDCKKRRLCRSPGGGWM